MVENPEEMVSKWVEESVALEQRGEYAAALQRALQALELAKNHGKASPIAAALVATARMRFRLGQYDRARRLADEALTFSEGPEDIIATARVGAFIILGNCAAETDSLAEADEYFRRAADLALYASISQAKKTPCINVKLA
jgi:tetratricopeptide (TPR) repeat protein